MKGKNGIDKGFEVYMDNTLFMFNYDHHTRKYNVFLLQHGKNWAYDKKKPVHSYSKGKGDTILQCLKMMNKYMKETKKIDGKI